MTISCYCCSCTPSPTNESQAASEETTKTTKPPLQEMGREEEYELAGTVQIPPPAQLPAVVLRPMQAQIIIVSAKPEEKAVENVIAFHAAMQSKENNPLALQVDAAGITALTGDLPPDSGAASSRRTSREHSGFGSQNKPVGPVGGFGTPRPVPTINPADLLNLNTLSRQAPTNNTATGQESL